MPKAIINLEKGEVRGVQRQIGKTNFGVYCEKCGEFFALAVVEMGISEFSFKADGPVLFQCAHCDHHQTLSPSQIQAIKLTESSARIPRPDFRIH